MESIVDEKVKTNSSTKDKCSKEDLFKSDENSNKGILVKDEVQEALFDWKLVKVEKLTFEGRDFLNADMLECNRCNTIFSNKQRLQSHIYKTHTAETTDQPEVNGLKGQLNKTWTPDIQRLVQRVDNCKMFVCDLCPYSVKRSDSMAKHVVRVHGKGLMEPQFVCEVCGKTFVDRAYFRNHSLSHNQDKKFSCEICGRRFHRQPSLKRHVLCHSSEKQFSCTLCCYKTNRKHLLYKHSENHRNGKAYDCKHCDVKFYTQLSLRQHCYLHHPTKHSCSFCMICFSSKERMWSHMQKIHFSEKK